MAVACEHPVEVLDVLDDSAVATALEPLVVALRIHLGEGAIVAHEIHRVALDVLQVLQGKAPATATAAGWLAGLLGRDATSIPK